MTDVDGATLDELHEILLHRYQLAQGDDVAPGVQAITSGELADRVTGEDSEANPKTREAVKILMRERGLPIIGSSHGYYIPTDPADIEEEIDALEGRSEGIQERQPLLRDNWENWLHREAMHADEYEQSNDNSQPDESEAATDGGPEELTEDEEEFLEDNPISRDELLARRRGGGSA
jgi:hypothetical protein